MVEQDPYLDGIMKKEVKMPEPEPDPEIIAFNKGIDAAIKYCKEQQDKHAANITESGEVEHTWADVENEVASNFDIAASDLEDLKQKDTTFVEKEGNDA